MGAEAHSLVDSSARVHENSGSIHGAFIIICLW